MANHNGLLYSIAEIDAPLPFVSTTVENSPAFFKMGFLHKLLIPNELIKHVDGIVMQGNSGAILLDGKIYISPQSFVYDIITEDIFEEINIWNADKESHTITSINITGQSSGFILTHPAVPFVLTAETDTIWPLKISIDGPAIQNTILTINFDNGFSIAIQIQGTRIIAYPFDCNFKSLLISYAYMTSIFQNDRFDEQRRPIFSKIQREMSVEYLHNIYQAQYQVNRTKQVNNKVLGVPFYSEPITTEHADIYGFSTLTVNQNLDSYWNMSQSQYLVIISISTSKAELKEILGYSINSIQLKYPIIGHFTKDDTVIYPAFLGIITERNFDSVADDTIASSIHFREVSL